MLDLVALERWLGLCGRLTYPPQPCTVFNVENACASASTAFHLAWQAVATGVQDAVLAVAAEIMTHPDKARSFAAIGGSVDVETAPADPPAGRSFLMDMYAGAALRYMERTGTTRADLARVVVKNHRHGQLNPAAQYGGELTVEQVLAAREIVWPFTLPMCSPISDGAAAALLVSQDLCSPGPAVAVLASAVRSAPAEEMTSVTSLAAAAAYEQAGLGPADLHCIEVHDAAASAVLAIYEQLGLAEPGDGAALIRSGNTMLGGPRPVNTSGGLLARGHPIGATGLAQIVEAVAQIRGMAGARQVLGARIALTQNAGGWHGPEGAIVESATEPAVSVPAAELRRMADPTGAGDAFRAGFLAGACHRLGHEGAARLGCVMAALVMETSGTQEYLFQPEEFLTRISESYRPGVATDMTARIGLPQPARAEEKVSAPASSK